MDEANGRLIGIIGLGDPVFSVAARDNWVGWSFQARRERLRNVMEAFILGAVPPYSMLLCGKLVAMLVCSEEVRSAFARKYGQRASLIQERTNDSRLAMVSTASALGRSSVYNRITYGGRTLYRTVGFTGGWGEFHFANGLYAKLFEFATRNCTPTAKHKGWGTGFRNRREVVRKCLAEIGLSDELMNHGVARELFVVPMAQNTNEFLRGEHVRLRWFHQTAAELFAYFRERWLLPRSERDGRWEGFDRRDYSLWSNGISNADE